MTDTRGLEAKMGELLNFLEEKNCFGLKVDCLVCEGCHLSETCPDYSVERLVHEEHKMDQENAKVEMDLEMKALDLIEEEAPKPTPESVADPVIDWNVLVSALISNKPTTLDSAVSIALGTMPDGTNPDFAAKSICSVVQKFATKGLLDLDGESIAWR